MLTPGPAADETAQVARTRTFDLAQIFAGLTTTKALVLAVSGGPDSMALLLLASRWASQLGRAAPRLHVATVDHGLRPDSAAEALFVAGAAETLDLPHATLVWSGPKPMTRIQERARAARYELLSRYATSVGATHVLTAHHSDDQAETVMLRLTRGSGLSGLSGMRRDTQLVSGLRLVRPLLSLTKADLVAVCRDESQRYVEDPSNENTAYARARLRSQSEALAKLGLDRVGLVRLARRLARADAALEAETDRVETALAPTRNADLYRVDLASLRGAEPEILLRLMQRAVTSLADAGRRIRLERLEALSEAVHAALKDGRPHRATLAGTRVILAGDGMLNVEREGTRRRGIAEKHKILASRSPLRPN